MLLLVEIGKFEKFVVEFVKMCGEKLKVMFDVFVIIFLLLFVMIVVMMVVLIVLVVVIVECVV